MTVAEAINRACDEAEKFDEACRIARQQEEAINELCAWTDELKDYRETGLTPEEVTALQASNQELKKEALPILQAKVQDRLVVLPCKVGDEVFFRLENGEVHKERVQGISMSASCDDTILRFGGYPEAEYAWGGRCGKNHLSDPPGGRRSVVG